MRVSARVSKFAVQLPSWNGGNSRQDFASRCNNFQTLVYTLSGNSWHLAVFVHHNCVQQAPKNRCADKRLGGTWCHSFYLARSDRCLSTSTLSLRISRIRYISAARFAENSAGQGRVKHAPRSGPKALDPTQFQQGKLSWPKWHFMPLGLNVTNNLSAKTLLYFP